MHERRRLFIPLAVVLVLILLTAFYLERRGAQAETGLIQASGTVEAVEVLVAPEIAGRVVEVMVAKGEAITSATPLFRLDDELWQAQRQRAVAALAAAQAGVETARVGLDLAETGREAAQAALRSARLGVEAAQHKYEMARSAARSAEIPARTSAWRQASPAEFNQPVWYFEKAEAISAAEANVNAAAEILNSARADLARTIQNIGAEDLAAAEMRLAEARAAFLIAKDILDRSRVQREAGLIDQAQSLFADAQDELEAAQEEYERLLESEAASEVLDGRARLAVAQAGYETALDQLDRLHTGDDALQVMAAALAVKQAEAAVEQAEAGVAQAEAGVRQAEAWVTQAKTVLDQAQAEVDLIDVQLNKLVVYAVEEGVVMDRTVEPGEFLQPGSVALSLYRPSDLTITVYIPEDRYGQIQLNSRAEVVVDSFPGETFSAKVVRIAGRAEFTPRNVQTDEGRRTTVFAVELAVVDNGGKLKPGMPADVTFNK